MKTQRSVALAVLIALGLALAGCADERQAGPTGTDQVGIDDYAKIDFDQPDGGLTPTDEAPAFGDPYLAQATAAAAGEAYDDPVASLPEVRRIEAAGGEEPAPGDSLRPRFTFLRIVWGDLDAPVDSTTGRQAETELADWSGRLWVDRGIVVVRRLIRFEPGDQIVRPRPDARTVEWVSHTGGGLDGLLIEILERPPLPPQDGVELPPPNRLHFASGPFTREFIVPELPRVNAVFEAGPAGAIHFTGFVLPRLDACPRGFLHGLWRDNPDPAAPAGGGFRGLWIGLHGVPVGHLMGRYGINEEGAQVFFGKYVGLDGRFRGLLGGTWEPSAEPGQGEFHGRWRGAAGRLEGVLGGRYLSHPERAGGFFDGRWAAACDDSAAARIP